MGNSVFYRAAFLGFYRLFCKLVNLGDFNLIFSGSISDFVELACLENAFLKFEFCGILVCYLQTRQVMSKSFLISCLLIYTSTSGKDFIVVPFAVPEILGAASTPLNTIKLSEKADSING